MDYVYLGTACQLARPAGHKSQPQGVQNRSDDWVQRLIVSCTFSEGAIQIEPHNICSLDTLLRDHNIERDRRWLSTIPSARLLSCLHVGSVR
jgi:hypothetical protein